MYRADKMSGIMWEKRGIHVESVYGCREYRIMYTDNPDEGTNSLLQAVQDVYTQYQGKALPTTVIAINPILCKHILHPYPVGVVVVWHCWCDVYIHVLIIIFLLSSYRSLDGRNAGSISCRIYRVAERHL